jgi:hypothetical protein
LSVRPKKLSIQQRVDKGYEFQLYVADLLAMSGYLEGQIFSTGLPRGTAYKHYEALQRLGKLRYTSPDIMVMNKWLEGPQVEFRFGLACSRRDTKFQRQGHDCSFSIPEYQRNDLLTIGEDNKLAVYHVFGRRTGDTYAVGVVEPGVGDIRWMQKDQSTGNPRWYVAYYAEKLWSWAEFLNKRIEAGDKEPNLAALKDYSIPSVTEV